MQRLLAPERATVSCALRRLAPEKCPQHSDPEEEKVMLLDLEQVIRLKSISIFSDTPYQALAVAASIVEAVEVP